MIYIFGFYLESLLKRSSSEKLFFTDKFSIADITAWRVIYWFTSGKLDLVNASFLNKLPLLKKYYEKISRLEYFQNSVNLEKFYLAINCSLLTYREFTFHPEKDN